MSDSHDPAPVMPRTTQATRRRKTKAMPGSDVITLTDPQGRTYRTSNRAEANNLIRTAGYREQP